MGAHSSMTIGELAKLDVAAQIAALEEIWSVLAQSNTLLPLTADERALLDERLAAEGGQPGKPWAQVRADIEGKL